MQIIFQMQINFFSTWADEALPWVLNAWKAADLVRWHAAQPEITRSSLTSMSCTWRLLELPATWMIAWCLKDEGVEEADGDEDKAQWRNTAAIPDNMWPCPSKRLDKCIS